MMSVSLFFVIAVAAVIAFVTSRSVWGRISVFVGVLAMFVVGVAIWNFFMTYRSTP
jgi:hypothetical protein